MRSTRLSTIFTLVCFFSFGHAYYYGRCRLCQNAISLDNCLTWTDCNKEEACFMDEVITEAGQIRYNGGCRPLDVCRNPSAGKKRAGNLIACSKCCNSDNYCNEKLCGLTRVTNLTMCNQCDGNYLSSGVHAVPPKYPEDCKVRTVCQSDELCFASTYTHGDDSLRHHTSCRKKAECVPLVKYILNLASDGPMVGKRDKQICAICCGDDMCNNIACEAIKGISVFILVSVLGSGKAYYYGRCRSCHYAASLEDCVTWADCTTNEVCYMEKIVTDALQIRYNGGCRSKNVCKSPSSTPIVGRRSAVACSSCCNWANYCNEHLCGISRVSNLTMCNQCDGHYMSNGNHGIPPTYPEDCTTRTVCRSDEMCFASTYTHGSDSLRSYTQCRKKNECVPLVKYILSLASDGPMVGKRDKQICAICCGDDMCNNIACEAIKGRLVNLTSDGWLDLDTLKEIL